MNPIIVSFLCSLLILPSLQADWLAFRGSNGNGSFDQKAPASLSLKSDKGWSQSARPGLSSPILVDDLVLLTASSGPNQQTLHILAFDAGTVPWNGNESSRPPDEPFATRRLVWPPVHWSATETR